MFNSKAKKEAIERAEKEEKKLAKAQRSVVQNAEELHEIRLESSKTTISKCERYISKLANAPCDFRKSIAQLRIKYEAFEKTADALYAESTRVNTRSGVGAGGGVLSGVGVAALGPSAAMAIATSFGTASTGAAISTLSGAAATNAGLAWLGGGALATGGGGMAMGQTILALAGPIGWTIGGVALVGSGLYLMSRNKKLAEEASELAELVHKEVLRFKRYLGQLQELIDRTWKHVKGVQAQLRLLESKAPTNYEEFTIDQKKQLMALVNNINSLSELLNKSVSH